MRFFIAILALSACNGSGSGDTDPIPGDTDTGPRPECITENEDCAPGTCGGEGSRMLPGSDCIGCHSAGNFEENEPDKYWTLAGTAFSDIDGNEPLADATIRVTDADDQVIELVTNSVGNFYTRRSVNFPISAEIEVNGETRQMTAHQETGSCNLCHSCVGEAGAKLHGP